MLPKNILREIVLREDQFFRELDSSSYWLTRVFFLRLLGFVYFIAFFSLSRQLGPLIGANGLLPAHLYLDQIAAMSGGGWAALQAVPTLLWLHSADWFMYVLCYLGVALALALLAGHSSAVLLFLLWSLYLSLYHVGQIFYGYGWEILLLETGFLAIFLCPLVRGGLLPLSTPPPRAVFWLLRWVLFRVMFGAGLIKLRGDSCWLDLTCMIYHYETQPIPNPISWYLHQLPPIVHQAEVLLTHLVELVVPWFIFGPRRLRRSAGIVLALFQLLLIASGNLSWLNWLTLALCFACFDDDVLRRISPRRLVQRWQTLGEGEEGLVHKTAVYGLTVVVILLSIYPVINMVSPTQVMNQSFGSLHLVNTYGAFGHVGKERFEVVLQGTYDTTLDAATQWREYEFKCKPGDVQRRPCIVSPYHYRLDWQIWFAAMSDYARNPWLVHLVYKLLQDDEGALSLLDASPFDQGPPRFIRAELYRYQFTQLGDGNEAWWERQHVRSYLPPLALGNRALLRVIDSFGWPRAAP
jgi:hypothetical protein